MRISLRGREISKNSATLTRTNIFISLILLFVTSTAAHAQTTTTKPELYWNVETGYTAPGSGVRWNDVFYFGSVQPRRDIVVCYEHQFGHFPKAGPHLIAADPDYMLEHLAEVEADLKRLTPDPDYSGLIVIDYESWAASWKLTGNATAKNAWRSYILDNYGRFLKGYTAEQLEGIYEATFNYYAKQFFLDTIRTVKSLRPNARVGYYGYPTRAYWPYVLYQHEKVRALHDEIAWLFDESDALFPSHYNLYYGLTTQQYFTNKLPGEVHLETNRLFARFSTLEAVRLADDKPIYPFVMLTYHQNARDHFGSLINEHDLRIAFETPIQYGADGLVVWGYITDSSKFWSHQYFWLTDVVPLWIELGYNG